MISEKKDECLLLKQHTEEHCRLTFSLNSIHVYLTEVSQFSKSNLFALHLDHPPVADVVPWGIHGGGIYSFNLFYCQLCTMGRKSPIKS